MNNSMKKQILIALGIACLMQPELFAMRARPMGSAERQAAIKQAINKKDYAKASQLAEGLTGPNKALFQDRIRTLQQDEARRAPARVIAEDQQAVVDAVNMPAGQAAVVAQEEGVPVPAPGEELPPVPAEQQGPVAEERPLPMPADQAKIAAAEQVFKDIKAITQSFIANSDFTKMVQNTNVVNMKVTKPAGPNPMVNRFADTLNKVLADRANKTPADALPANLSDRFVHITAAFDAGRSLFFAQAERIHELNETELLTFYNTITNRAIPDADTFRGISNLLVLMPDKNATQMELSRFNRLEGYEESTLIEILPSLAILIYLYQNNGPMSDAQEATLAQMKKQFRFMQVVTILNFFAVGKKLGADIGKKTWSGNLPEITRRFWAPDATKAKLTEYLVDFPNQTPATVDKIVEIQDVVQRIVDTP